MLNLGSLVLGLGAWGFALSSMAAPRAAVSHRRSVFSFCFCTVSLLFQLLEIGRRVSLGDYAGIEDTIRAVLLASAVLTAVTILLNLAAYGRSRKEKDQT